MAVESLVLPGCPRRTCPPARGAPPPLGSACPLGTPRKEKRVREGKESQNPQARHGQAKAREGPTPRPGPPKRAARRELRAQRGPLQRGRRCIHRRRALGLRKGLRHQHSRTRGAGTGRQEEDTPRGGRGGAPAAALA